MGERPLRVPTRNSRGTNPPLAHVPTDRNGLFPTLPGAAREHNAGGWAGQDRIAAFPRFKVQFFPVTTVSEWGDRQ